MGLMMKGSKNFAILLVGTALALSACTPSNSEKPEIKSNAEDSKLAGIINGTDIKNHSVLSKSVVLLKNMLTQEVCSATLIGTQFALTAAHCLDRENPNNLWVYFAAQPNDNSERRMVLDSKAGPLWDLRQAEDTNTGDIAVIKFEGSALPEGYEPAEFLAGDQKITKGMQAVVLGYGIKDATTHIGAGTLSLTVLTISNADFSPTEIVLDQSKGTSVCHGDSGGPAYFYMKNAKGKNQLYLWGVANHATLDDEENTCDKGVVYTNALPYQPWIQLVMKSL